MNRHELLRRLHQVVRPRTYLEIGVHHGASMALSHVPSIGVDPDYSVSAELTTSVHLARTTSDEFFARKDPLAYWRTPVIDLAFIDGMHLSEYVLRDYLNVERFTTPASVILFDDMLPRSVEEAARRRETHEWAGDVFKAAEALREHRPDLLVVYVDTTPTGTALVLAPDASRAGVLPQYDEWLSEVGLAPDPQKVPEHILGRTIAVAPERLLESGGWLHLRHRRGSRRLTQAQVREMFAHLGVPAGRGPTG
jgi:predicted O-methyltransferase YrrM